MRINYLDLAHFGKFHDKHLDLAPGINVIYGKNEAGKSTVHSFIGCMFFGAERLRGRGAGRDTYSRFLPWEGSGAYAGSMGFTYKDRDYRILRDFQKDASHFSILDEQSGFTAADGQGDISILIPGFTQEKYRNTISAGQVSLKMDDSFGTGMQNYMANLSMSANEEVDIEKALSYLKAEKGKIQTKAARVSTEQEEAKAQELQSEIGREAALQDELAGLERERQQIRSRMEALSKEYDAVVREDQRARAAAIRLIQENNDIATQYREKKAALAKVAGRGKGRSNEKELVAAVNSCQQYNQRISDLRYRQAGVRGGAEGAGVRAAALSIPIAAIALMVWLLGANIGIPESGRQILAMVLGILAVVVFLGMLISGMRKGRLVRELEEEILELAAAQKSLLKRFGAASVEELQNGLAYATSGYQEEDRLRRELSQLRSRYEALQEPLRPYIEKYGESLSLESDAGEKQREEIEALKKQETDKKKAISQIEWKMEQIAEKQRALDALRELISKKKEDRKAEEEELEAIELSMSMIRNIATQLHVTFGAELNEEVSRLFAIMSEGEHDRILLDDKFQILIDDGGKPARIGQMSAGTEDQIYFSIRLAVSRIFFDENMPLLLDDSFALYDDRRLEHTLRWLGQRSGFEQILIFTCHHREAEILARAGIPYTLHQLD